MRKLSFMILSVSWRWCVFAIAIFLFLKKDFPRGIITVNPFLIISIILGYAALSSIFDFFTGKSSKNLILIASDIIAGCALLCLSPHYPSSAVFTLPILTGFRLGKSPGYWISVISILGFFFTGIIISFVSKQFPSIFQSLDLIFSLGLFFLAFICGDISAHLVRQEERTDALISLIKLSQELGVSSTLQQVLTTGLNVVKVLFPVHSCVIYMKSGEEKHESIIRVKAYSSKIPEVFIDFDPEITPSIIGKTIKEKSDQLVGNYSADPREDVIPKDKGLRSMMITPLSVEDKALGAMLIAHTIPDYYSQEDLKLLSMLSAQIALAVRHIQIQETMGTMAITDSLSGLFTHGYFQENLSEALTKAKYDNKPISILIIDVDFFKKVNDTYGHPQGDALLKQLGGVLRSLARKDDVLCRYGGDEFTVTMANTNRISAVILAEKIRTSVEEYEFVLKGQVAHITISGGVASFPEDAQTKKELIECADKALYQSKQAGRNKISFGASKK